MTFWAKLKSCWGDCCGGPHSEHYDAWLARERLRQYTASEQRRDELQRENYALQMQLGQAVNILESYQSFTEMGLAHAIGPADDFASLGSTSNGSFAFAPSPAPPYTHPPQPAPPPARPTYADAPPPGAPSERPGAVQPVVEAPTGPPQALAMPQVPDAFAPVQAPPATTPTTTAAPAATAPPASGPPASAPPALQPRAMPPRVVEMTNRTPFAPLAQVPLSVPLSRAAYSHGYQPRAATPPPATTAPPPVRPMGVTPPGPRARPPRRALPARPGGRTLADLLPAPLITKQPSHSV